MVWLYVAGLEGSNEELNQSLLISKPWSVGRDCCSSDPRCHLPAKKVLYW